MKSRHLKFSSKSEAESVLFKTVDGVLVPKFSFIADVIGQIYKPTGRYVTNAEGLAAEVNLLPGWHVNVRGLDADKFAQYEVVANTPNRGWF